MLSKKVIFHLHRFNADQGWPHDGTGNSKLLAEGHEKLDQVYQLLRDCGKAEALVSESSSRAPSPDMLRYEPFIGGSLEELIEAASFIYFLEHRGLIPLTLLQEKLCEGGVQCMYISPRRYVLGISDLTGELMRFAINSVATRKCLDVIRDVMGMQQDIYAGALDANSARSTRSHSRRHQKEAVCDSVVTAQGRRWCVFC